MAFSITYDSVAVSIEVCNQLTIYFRINPIYSSYHDADFSVMYVIHNDSRLTYVNSTFKYSTGLIGYIFNYTGELVGRTVTIIFVPSRLGLS